MLSVAEDLVGRREGPCWREEDVHRQTSVTAARLPYGHGAVPVPAALSLPWGPVSDMPLLPGRADLQGLALCGRQCGAAWALSTWLAMVESKVLVHSRHC